MHPSIPPTGDICPFLYDFPNAMQSVYALDPHAGLGRTIDDCTRTFVDFTEKRAVSPSTEAAYGKSMAFHDIEAWQSYPRLPEVFSDFIAFGLIDERRTGREPLLKERVMTLTQQNALPADLASSLHPLLRLITMEDETWQIAETVVTTLAHGFEQKLLCSLRAALERAVSTKSAVVHCLGRYEMLDLMRMKLHTSNKAESHARIASVLLQNRLEKRLAPQDCPVMVETALATWKTWEGLGDILAETIESRRPPLEPFPASTGLSVLC